MPASTAPDFHPVVKDLPRVAVAPGATLELLVLSADGDHCAGVDLASGALVRAWSPSPAEDRYRPYDVVSVTLDEDHDGLPDPHQPEALFLTGPPEPLRRLSGRPVQRLLRPLVHPRQQPLLGISSSVIPFWERRPDHPSIAVVEPEGPIRLRRESAYLACRFGWQGHERELPCVDRHLAAAMDRTGRRHLVAAKGYRLLVALTPPMDGRCHKVVQTLLPRP